MKKLLLLVLVFASAVSCDFITDSLKLVVSAPREESNVEEPVVPQVKADPRRVYCCAYDGFVNMRGWPSYKSRVIAIFRNGPEGAILLEYRDKWTKIDLNGTIGWVPTKYVWRTPTIAYTGRVDIDWVAGIWNQPGGYVYVLYSNGYWEKSYNYGPFEQGYFIMQNNEVKLVTVCTLKEADFQANQWAWSGAIGSSNDVGQIFKINERTGKLGDLEKEPFLTGYESAEEMEGVDWGPMTKAEFKASGKRCAIEVRRFLR